MIVSEKLDQSPYTVKRSIFGSVKKFYGRFVHEEHVYEKLGIRLTTGAGIRSRSVLKLYMLYPYNERLFGQAIEI